MGTVGLLDQAIGRHRPRSPRGADWIVLVGYGIAFLAAHRAAALWGGSSYYSLWFPAAGLRFFVLWRFGARLTLPVAAVEIVMQIANGVVQPSGDWPTQVIGVARPVLAYGLAIAVVRFATERGKTSLVTPPMPFGLAAVLAPIVAVMFALPWAVLRPAITHVAGMRQIVASLTAFAVGDLLGVLLVAPPLLWLADVVAGRAAFPRPSLAHAVEAITVLAASLAIVIALSMIGLGLPATPVLLGTAWIGLRFGRAAAWAAIVMVALVVLPHTAGSMPIDQRLALHMSLAAVVVVGYLAGSFSEAEARARVDIARRDRMLFQAERLKTLRAMSVAVIHEISQPLSTLAIEARHLAEITRTADDDIATSATLIDRKANALSVLVRRLRRFGGRAVDEPSLLPVSALIETVSGLSAPEAKAAGVTLVIGPVDPDLLVLAQEVELAQALINVVRNAIQASTTGTGAGKVHIAVDRGRDEVTISVANQSGEPAPHAGMGVGTLVARAIVEAHQGRLGSEHHGGQHVVRLMLPLTGDQK